jgi:CubicO group peptidase (beta-lactamase class C family)
VSDLLSHLESHVDEVIDAALRRERIVGVAVVVSLAGSPAYERAAGYADRERALAMRSNAIFRAASLSKPIVSATALAMIERKVLSLDEPIRTWLPDFITRTSEGIARDITVRQLLTHTSGLDYGFGDRRGEFAELGIGSGLDRPGLGMGEQLRRLAKAPLNFVPGESWKYSLSTDVLGAVLQEAAGEALPALVSRFVTSPLNMRDTSFSTADTNRLAVPYVDGMPRPTKMAAEADVPTYEGIVRFVPERMFDESSFPSGGAGMTTTAADFLCFLEVVRLGGGSILNETSTRLMTTDQLPPSVLYPDRGWRFGMGAAILARPDLTRTYHDTGTWRWGGGYGHDWFVNPARALTVVSMTNTAFEGADGLFPRNLCEAIYYALTAD